MSRHYETFLYFSLFPLAIIYIRLNVSAYKNDIHFFNVDLNNGLVLFNKVM